MFQFLKGMDLTFSCNYLLYLSKVQQIREHLDIGPDVTGSVDVIKYGRTTDFVGQMKRHMSVFGRFSIQIKKFLHGAIADDRSTILAERDVRDFLRRKHAGNVSGFTEVMIFDLRSIWEELRALYGSLRTACGTQQ